MQSCGSKTTKILTNGEF